MRDYTANFNINNDGSVGETRVSLKGKTGGKTSIKPNTGADIMKAKRRRNKLMALGVGAYIKTASYLTRLEGMNTGNYTKQRQSEKTNSMIARGLSIGLATAFNPLAGVVTAVGIGIDMATRASLNAKRRSIENDTASYGKYLEGMTYNDGRYKQ